MYKVDGDLGILGAPGTSAGGGGVGEKGAVGGGCSSSILLGALAA